MATKILMWVLAVSALTVVVRAEGSSAQPSRCPDSTLTFSLCATADKPLILPDDCLTAWRVL